MNDDLEAKIGCGCLLIAILALAFWGIVYYKSGETITGTVEKTVVDRGNTYFVIREDGSTQTEIMENEDSWLYLKLNSGDILMNLEVGKHYSFRVAGWRVYPLSLYRNIISYQELE